MDIKYILEKKQLYFVEIIKINDFYCEKRKKKKQMTNSDVWIVRWRAFDGGAWVCTSSARSSCLFQMKRVLPWVWCHVFCVRIVDATDRMHILFFCFLPPPFFLLFYPIPCEFYDVPARHLCAKLQEVDELERGARKSIFRIFQTCSTRKSDLIWLDFFVLKKILSKNLENNQKINK